jgi:hypothetical protein
MLQAARSPVRVPDEVDFFSRTMALGSTQPLIGMSTRNLPGSKKRLEHRADYLAAICKPQPLATLKVYMACTGITLPFTYQPISVLNKIIWKFCCHLPKHRCNVERV